MQHPLRRPLYQRADQLAGTKQMLISELRHQCHTDILQHQLLAEIRIIGYMQRPALGGFAEFRRLQNIVQSVRPLRKLLL